MKTHLRASDCEHMEFRGDDTLGEGMEAWQPFFTSCRVHLFQLAVPELQAFIINQYSRN